CSSIVGTSRTIYWASGLTGVEARNQRRDPGRLTSPGSIGPTPGSAVSLRDTSGYEQRPAAGAQTARRKRTCAFWGAFCNTRERSVGSGVLQPRFRAPFQPVALHAATT